jgi:hypothetical protein
MSGRAGRIFNGPAGKQDAVGERCVAMTGWRLIFRTKDTGQPVLNINEPGDVEIHLFHRAVTRP